MRHHRKTRIRKKIKLLQGRFPRLVVYRSNRYLYAQVIDDLKSQTLVQANTREKDFSRFSSKKNLESAKTLGLLIGQRSIEKKIDRVLFDRSGYDYHGRVKSIGEGAREAGLKF